MSAHLLIDFYARLLAATEGTLEEWSQCGPALDAGCVERAVWMLVKIGGSALDALPYLRRGDADGAGALLDLLGRAALLARDLAGRFRRSAHGVVGELELGRLVERVGRCREKGTGRNGFPG